MLCRGLNKIKIVTFQKKTAKWHGKNLGGENAITEKKECQEIRQLKKNDGEERVERRVPSIIFKQTIKLNHFTSSTLPMPGSWCCLPPWIRQAKNATKRSSKEKNAKTLTGIVIIKVKRLID